MKKSCGFIKGGKDPQEIVQIPILPEQSQESDSIPGHPSNNASNKSLIMHYLDVPIAIRKGVR